MFSILRFPRLSLLLAGALGLAVLPSSMSAANTSDPLQSAPSTLAFGSVKVSHSRSLTVALTNTRSFPVTISTVRRSDRNFAIQGLSMPLTLSAGETATFSIAFAPTSSQKIHGIFTFVGSGLTLGSLTVHGTGLTSGSLTANPSSISFGNVPLGKRALKTQTLTNSGDSDVTIIWTGSTGGPFWISGIHTPLTLHPGTSITFRAHFYTKSAGPVSGNAKIVSSATDSNLSIPFTANGSGAGQLSISPANLNFGNVPVGTSKSVLATLSAGGAGATISSITRNNSEFSVSGVSLPLSLARGQRKSFTITFTPQSSGAAHDNLSFKTTAGVTGQSLTGAGVAAAQHRVTLSWDPSISQVIGYNIYRASQSGGPFTQLNSVLESGTSYIDNTVQGGQTYFYVITATEQGGGESTYSKQVQTKVPGP